MSLLLLDTTFVIDRERDGASLDSIGDEDDVAVAAITIAELKVGVNISRGRTRAARRKFYERLVETVPILPYDEHIAEHHADLLVSVRRAGRPRGAHDLIIAATGVAHDREIVSNDRAAFADLPGVSVRSHG